MEFKTEKRKVIAGKIVIKILKKDVMHAAAGDEARRRRSAIAGDEARLDICALSFWMRGQEPVLGHLRLIFCFA